MRFKREVRIRAVLENRKLKDAIADLLRRGLSQRSQPRIRHRVAFLCERLWPSDVFVDLENNLNAAVNRLREALGDSAHAPRYVETVPRRGYRLLVPVTLDSPAEAQDGQRCEARHVHLPCIHDPGVRRSRAGGRP